jgi:hypothetical protein
MNDLVDTTRRDADVTGQAVLGQAHRAEELLEEDLPGVNRRQLLRSHRSSSVIVDDLDLICVPIAPLETDTPLVIDANAALTRSVPRQLFESIPGWHPEILERLGSVEDREFPESDSLQIPREST